MQFCDKFLFDCSFNGFEWFLIFLNKILLLRFAYILYIYNAKVGGRKWISKWENWPPQVWLNPHFQSFAHLSDPQLILFSNATNDFMISKFFSFFITFRTNVWLSIISPCSFLFSIQNISKLLFYFSLWFKFYAAWFSFLSKCKKEWGKKLTGRTLNVFRQFCKDVICIFWCYFV